MRWRLLAATLSLTCLVAGSAAAQQTLLASAVGPRYDEVANCLMKRMEPRLFAAPVVHPPPTDRAEVHLYIPGTQAVGTPVADFFVSQLDNGTTSVRFAERSGHHGQYIAAATAAAAVCTR